MFGKSILEISPVNQTPSGYNSQALMPCNPKSSNTISFYKLLVEYENYSGQPTPKSLDIFAAEA